jgi:hypothetical protein
MRLWRPGWKPEGIEAMLEPGGNIEGKPEVEGVRSRKERRTK